MDIKPVGETPTGATETVALPFSTESFRRGEREKCLPPQAEGGRVNTSEADCGDSLSAGERVGVRGKVTLLAPTACKKVRGVPASVYPY